MRILLLSDANSTHTHNWLKSLCERGITVALYSLRRPEGEIWKRLPLNAVEVRWSNAGLRQGPIGKAFYLTAVPAIRNFVREFRPDVLHAHYATSYGIIGALCGFKPFVVSVWGSDVYDFPKISILHRFIIKRILRHATYIASTSECMAKQVKMLIPEETSVFVTPFGVDVTLFIPAVHKPAASDGVITVGTVKTMAFKYGIDTLIKAFALSKKYFADSKKAHTNLKLLIAGGGPDLKALKLLAEELGVADSTEFMGSIAHKMVPAVLARMDVFMALSRLDSESFGVAAVEAGAMAIPVVVSDAGGLPEVVIHLKTGLVVPRDNPEAAARAIIELVEDGNMRLALGNSAREHVLKHYSQSHCTDIMLSLYSLAIDEARKI